MIMIQGLLSFGLLGAVMYFRTKLNASNERIAREKKDAEVKAKAKKGGKRKGKGPPKGKSRKASATPRLIGSSSADDDLWADWQGTAAAINSTWWDQSGWGSGSWSSTQQTLGWH